MMLDINFWTVVKVWAAWVFGPVLFVLAICAFIFLCVVVGHYYKLIRKSMRRRLERK